MNKSLLLLALPAVLTACAGVPLPQDQREVTFVEKTTATQAQAYQRAMTYLAKNLGDSNLAIKVKDEKAGTIVTQIAIDCSDLRTFMDLNRHVLWANLEFNAKDNKARMVFEAFEDRVYNAVGGSFIATHAISRPERVTNAKPCFDRQRAEILKAIAAGAKSDNW